MSGSRQLFSFQVLGADASVGTFGCMAAGKQEAEREAARAGHDEVLLLEVTPVAAMDERIVVLAEVTDSPLFGARWLPLVDALSAASASLKPDGFWRLQTLAEAQGFDARSSPFAQAMYAADGSLHVEVGGVDETDTEAHLRHAKLLALLGWIPPGEGEVSSPMAHRSLPPGWTGERVAVQVLEAFVLGFGMLPTDPFSLGPHSAEILSIRGLRQVGAEVFVLNEPEVASREVGSLLQAFLRDAGTIDLADDLDLTDLLLSRPADWSEALDRARRAIPFELRKFVDTVRRSLIPLVRGDHSGIAANAALHALLARDSIGPDGFTQVDYDLLTRPWRLTIGELHPDDKEVADRLFSPQAGELRKARHLLRHLTARQRFLLEAHSEDDMNYDTGEAWWRALAACASERRGLPHYLTLGPIQVPEAGLRALLGLAARDLVTEKGIFTHDEWEALTLPWAMAIGRLHPGDSSLVQTHEGPQAEEIASLISRAIPFRKELHAATEPDTPELVAARFSAWKAAFDEHREGPWTRSSELQPQALADAADALIVRDLIEDGYFSQDDYDLLTRAWRRVAGPVHPED